MSDDDFVGALRRADSRWRSERASQKLDERLDASIHRPGRSSRALWMVAVTGALAGVAMVLATRERPAPAVVEDAELVEFEPARCAPVAASPVLRLEKGCVVALRAPAMTIRAVEPVELLRGVQGIEVVRGVARFDVEHVAAGAAPVVVVVAEGRIEVIGTRFVVSQGIDAGSVFLEVGRIDFVTKKGARDRIEAGHSRRWGHDVALAPAVERAPDDGGVARVPPVKFEPPIPEPPVSAPPAAPETPPMLEPQRAPSELTPEALLETTPPRTWSVEQTSRAVQWVSKLRAEGRYAETVVWIARLLQAPLDDRAAEVLSFERGRILERKLGDVPGACRHWEVHRARFKAGRYEAEVAAALNRCPPGNSRPVGRE